MQQPAVFLPNARVELIGTEITEEYSRITGLYKTGIADSGEYDVRFTHNDCRTLIVPNAKLRNGEVTILDVSLDCDNLSVGINDITNEANAITAVIGPNPFSDAARLTFELQQTDGLLSVYDVVGNQHLSLPLDTNTGVVSFGNDWPAGMYFAVLESAGQRKTLPFVKVNQ